MKNIIVASLIQILSMFGCLTFLDNYNVSIKGYIVVIATAIVWASTAILENESMRDKQ